MEKYNRDGPPEETPHWEGIIFGLVAGFLAGGVPLPFAAWLYRVNGGNNPSALILLLVLSPLAALSGGIVGMWMAWRLRRPSP